MFNFHDNRLVNKTALLLIFFLLFFSNISFAAEQTESENIIKAYYFHTTYRCASCVRLEQWSYGAIIENFQKEMKAGLLQWESINVEKSENKHYVNEYRLYTKSLVLVEIKNNQAKRYVNLQKVWQLLRDRKAFSEYVKQEVRKFIEAK